MRSTNRPGTKKRIALAITCVILFTIALTACSKRTVPDGMEQEALEGAEGSRETSNGFEERREMPEISEADKATPDGLAESRDAAKIELSMEDAIALGREAAMPYDPDLRLTEIHSYDNDDILNPSSGADGKRQWWYVNFANTKGNYVSVLICDGAVEHVEHFDQNANTGLFDVSAIQLTAAEAAQKAQKMGLTGGNPEQGRDWISGYHYKLSCGSLAESPDDIRILLEVIGISPNGNFAHVDFDAVTGECLLAEEETEDRGWVRWRGM